MSKLYNNIKTAVLLGTLSGLILLAGQLIGGRTGLILAIGFAAVTNFVGYFFSDKLALMSMGAQQVGSDHWLFQTVQRQVAAAGLPMPRVYVSPPSNQKHQPPD
ncbi:MAG: heat shock protein HtpX [Phycisphaerales bacterium]|nr:heat shock protein HtpX [Phycisphaerales bacterium]